MPNIENSELKAEPRKATDIILELEQKVEQLLYLSRSQDLNIKILSNKINMLIEAFNKISIQNSIPIPNPSNNMITSPPLEAQIRIEPNPTGFRRTSRPETYVAEQPQTGIGSAPVPVAPKTTELLWDPNKPKAPKTPAPKVEKVEGTRTSAPSVAGVVKSPIIQRVLDINGKSIFNANVEIINTQANSIAYTTRTNSTGVWQASLEPGTYKVNVTRSESLSKTKINMVMEFSVATSGTQIKLPDMIAK